MFLKSYVLFLCGFYLIPANGNKAIDMDYFLSVLRNNNCSTKDGLQYCSELCRGVPVVCHRGDCFCHQSVVDAVSQPKVLASLGKNEYIARVGKKMRMQNDDRASGQKTIGTTAPLNIHIVLNTAVSSATGYPWRATEETTSVIKASYLDAVLQPKVLASLDLMMAPEAIAASKNEVQINISPQIVPNGESNDVPVIMVADEYLQGRRHQIAHFCPSLDVARECINKCVKLGKPAFCGKDHKCYCGHKYSDHDSKDQQDALDVYKQFADMYAKYFGNSERDTGSDENDDYDKLKKKNTIKILKNI